MVRVAGPLAEVDDGTGVREVRLAPRLPGGPPVAGDRVRVDDSGSQGIVREVLPRRTVLERIGSGGRVRAVVANADLLLVVAAVAEPPLQPRLIDRYAVAAVAGGLDMAVVLTKDDRPHDPVVVEQVAAQQRAAGHQVLVGSALDPGLVERVRDLIDGRIAALAGHSGVGKSSLANAVEPGLGIKVRDVSHTTGKGMHTTTYATMHPLAQGGWILDTPGIKEFGIVDLEREEVGHYFPEFAELLEHCRFHNCLHLNEPDCAVREALEAGRIAPSRYDSYLSILEDAGTPDWA